MPRKLRAAGKQRIADWEKFRTYLSFGWDYFSEIGTDYPPAEDVQQAWAVLRDSLMQEFAADKNKSGQRPYAWWVLEQGFDHRPSRGEQRDFLESHNLLSEAEKAALAEQDARYANWPDDPAHNEWLHKNGHRRPPQTVKTLH